MKRSLRNIEYVISCEFIFGKTVTMSIASNQNIDSGYYNQILLRFWRNKPFSLNFHRILQLENTYEKNNKGLLLKQVSVDIMINFMEQTIDKNK